MPSRYSKERFALTGFPRTADHSRYDEQHPRCRNCHGLEPCGCAELCGLCLLLITRGEQHPCHGDKCYPVKFRRNTNGDSL